MTSGNIPTIVSFNWYRREDYPRILEIMEERDKLAVDYDSWLKSAEAGIKHMKDKGMTPIKTEIRPDPFLAWCRENGCRLDATARSEYASRVAVKIHRDESGH